jgi:hypothetical protein
MNESTIHFVNGDSLEIKYSSVKHNRKNDAVVFVLEDGRCLTVNWNNVLCFEETL